MSINLADSTDPTDPTAELVGTYPTPYELYKPLRGEEQIMKGLEDAREKFLENLVDTIEDFNRGVRHLVIGAVEGELSSNETPVDGEIENPTAEMENRIMPRLNRLVSRVIKTEPGEQSPINGLYDILVRYSNLLAEKVKEKQEEEREEQREQSDESNNIENWRKVLKTVLWGGDYSTKIADELANNLIPINYSSLLNNSNGRVLYEMGIKDDKKFNNDELSEADRLDILETITKGLKAMLGGDPDKETGEDVEARENVNTTEIKTPSFINLLQEELKKWESRGLVCDECEILVIENIVRGHLANYSMEVSKLKEEYKHVVISRFIDKVVHGYVTTVTTDNHGLSVSTILPPEQEGVSNGASEKKVLYETQEYVLFATKYSADKDKLPQALKYSVPIHQTAMIECMLRQPGFDIDKYIDSVDSVVNGLDESDRIFIRRAYNNLRALINVKEEQIKARKR